MLAVLARYAPLVDMLSHHVLETLTVNLNMQRNMNNLCVPH